MKKNGFIVLMLTLGLVSCNQSAPDATNPARFLLNPQKQQMVQSTRDLYNGELYELDYTVDYLLDTALNADIKSTTELYAFFFKYLLDIVPTTTTSIKTPTFGCSMFAATDTTSNHYLLGRNYDYCHTLPNGSIAPSSAILLRTAPANGKRSISMVDGMFIGLPKGFKGNKLYDVSLLMAMPYLTLDGINEAGLACGVLFLDGNCAFQPGTKHIWGTTLLRLALDKASTVVEAENLIKTYNITMRAESPCSYHFMLADSTGDYAIVECSYGQEQSVEKDEPSNLLFLRGKDFSYVTNFYVDPRMANESIGGLSNHGRARYDTLKNTLQVKSYHLTKTEAMDLLKAVSQEPQAGVATSSTQWSSVYDLNRRTLDIVILRRYGQQLFSFSAVDK